MEMDKEVESVELERKGAFSIVEENEKDKKQESAVQESEQVHRLIEEKEQAILALESEPVFSVKEGKEGDKRQKWSINIEELITEFSNQDGIRDGTAASEVVEEVATTLVAASKEPRKTKRAKSISRRIVKGTTKRLSTGIAVTQSVGVNVSTEARVPELKKGNTAEKTDISFGLSKESTETGAKLVELGSDTLEDSAKFEEESHLLGPVPA